MERYLAFSIVNKYVKNQSLVNHMLSVESAMRWYANHLNEDVDKWGICGLLHDFDWEINPTIEKHPIAGSTILAEHEVPADIIRAIQSHANHTGVSRITQMEKALYACDEITGLITAVALVRPSKSLYDLTAQSVKKKWKDKAFAAGANREEMQQSAIEFGIDIWEHVDNVIAAMSSIASALNLEGNLVPPKKES